MCNAADLLALAEAIEQQTGRYTALNVDLHPGREPAVTVSVLEDDSDPENMRFHWMRGGGFSTEQTLKELREELVNYIRDNRAEVAA